MSTTPRAFEIDARSLGALRIGLGALLLADLAYRALDLRAHYGDEGVLPAMAWRALFGDVPGLWSLHLAIGELMPLVAVFAVQALFGLGLLLGVHTRSCALLSWLLLLSLQHRNPLVLTAADDVLRLLLFWSLFLPLDARFALRPAAASRGVASVCSPASMALLLQVALLYAFSVYFKLSADWQNLDAVRATLAVEGVATDWGRWLGQQPWLPELAALGTLLIESLAVVLPFVAWRGGVLRLGTALLLPAYHVLAVAPALRLGLMPAAMTLAWVPFLPGSFWDRFGYLARGEVAAARPPRAMRIVVLAALALVLIENGASVLRSRDPSPAPPPQRGLSQALGLTQNWQLWDRPIPNRYYVFAATLADGNEVDLHTGRALDWEQPRRRSENNHWWKYQMHLARRYAASLRPWYASWLAGEWLRDHPDARIESLSLVRLNPEASGARRERLWEGRPVP